MNFITDRMKKTFPGIVVHIVAAGTFMFSGNAISQTTVSLRDCSDCPELVEIPRGSFLMGSDTGRDDEKPRHRVNIGNRFAVGKYEVTRRQYAIFIEESNFKQVDGCEVYDLPSFNLNLSKNWTDPDFKQNANHPVVCVNWHDAQAYVGWLTAKTGKKYRLLSEAEWGICRTSRVCHELLLW